MTKFRIQYLSNLFLSYKNPATFSSVINPVAPYLALLGNIGQSNCKVTRKFFKDAEQHFDKIFWIPGSLEYSCHQNANKIMWQKKSEDFNKSIVDWRLQKTTFCQKSLFVRPNMPFTVLATPCWYMTMSSQYNHKIYDYESYTSSLRQMNNLDFVYLYYNELAWIQSLIRKSEHPVFLLTHAPIDPILLSQEKLTYHLYGTEIDEKLSVKTGGYEPWIGINTFGHEHFSKEAFIEHKIIKPKYY